MKTDRKNISIEKVHFKATGGADIYDCINACIAISAKNDVKCSLTHNGITVDVSAKKLCEEIYVKWDKELHKK